MFKEEFPPEQDWFKNHCVRVDLGFLGIEKDYAFKELLLPNKKKKNQELSLEQKSENKSLASERIVIAHEFEISRPNILGFTRSQLCPI